MNHWVLGNSDRVRMCRFSKKGVFVPVLQSMDHTSALINYHTQKTGICFIKNLLLKIILHIVWFYRNYQNKLTIFHQLYENICKIFGMCIDHHPVQKKLFLFWFHTNSKNNKWQLEINTLLYCVQLSAWELSRCKFTHFWDWNSERINKKSKCSLNPLILKWVKGTKTGMGKAC